MKENKLEELIKKLCPNGVEYKKLEDCCNILDNERKPVTKSARIKGEYPYYGANGIQDYVSDYIFDGTFVLVGEDGSVINKNGNPVVTWAEGKIWVNNHAHVIKEKENVLLRYLYHYIQTINVSVLIHGNIPKLNQGDFRNLRIAVPPLEVQCEIVHILDDFTLLSAELSAELKARRKQYEYYKEKLFNLESEEKKLKDVAQIYDSLHATPKYVKQGYPMIRVADVKFGIVNSREALKVNEDTFKKFTSKYEPQKEDIIISRVGSFGNVCIVGEEKICLGQNTSVIHPLINKKYLYFYLASEKVQSWIKENVNGAGYKSLTLANINEIPIKVPSDKKQGEIANILERFDKLCNDISEGLPAEIEARKQQYEYYREKLLTFKELKND
jgi:HP848-like protein